MNEPGGALINHQGPSVPSIASHNVYVNCADPVTCWGDPATFLTALEFSTFVHVVDQYTGPTANQRYTVGKSAKVSVSTPLNVLYDADILAIVHRVAKRQQATGYGHIYHVFLPQGTDECQTSFGTPGQQCYSPDSPSTFYYCAYHGAVDFGDIGHVLYSVEPYQETPGCGDTYQPTNTPGSGPPAHKLIDSTSTTLSHELFEALTDPDGTAWYNAYGYEIGDLCNFQRNTINLHGTNFVIQPEFSNRATPNGDCVFR